MTFRRKLGNVVFILGGLAPEMGELAFIVTNLFLVLALHTAFWGGRGGSEELSSLPRGSLPHLACHLVPRPLRAFLSVSPPSPIPSFLFLSREVMTANGRPPPGLFSPFHPFLGCTCSKWAWQWLGPAGGSLSDHGTWESLSSFP